MLNDDKDEKLYHSIIYGFFGLMFALIIGFLFRSNIIRKQNIVRAEAIISKFNKNNKATAYLNGVIKINPKLIIACDKYNKVELIKACVNGIKTAKQKELL